MNLSPKLQLTVFFDSAFTRHGLQAVSSSSLCLQVAATSRFSFLASPARKQDASSWRPTLPQAACSGESKTLRLKPKTHLEKVYRAVWWRGPRLVSAAARQATEYLVWLLTRGWAEGLQACVALTHMCRVIQRRWLALVPSHRRTCAHASCHAHTNAPGTHFHANAQAEPGQSMPTASQYTVAFFRLLNPSSHYS